MAAGRGERLGAPGPKAFVMLGDRPLYAWSLEALRAAPSVTQVVVAVPAGSEAEIDGALAVAGGASRSESVRNALAAAPAADDVVVVHDAARPLLDAGLVERCVAGLEGFDAVVAAAPVTDTIKRAGGDHVVRETLDRSALWAVQTPQVFRREALERALAQPSEVLAAATDDAGLVEALGGRVGVVPSARENLKVTTPIDLRVAELLLDERRGPA
ncbi:MAG TPA: 2-C-methyl-D-erythritol 4-phosphate cytidylyltransferase [Capillimicrobium sp.]|nr:2-C-methyl-D-erythritol 4-phosphate cytidylyltransferase [Capillimicrobium sp.]